MTEVLFHRPGEPGGPCTESDCGHTLCLEIMRQANASCPRCDVLLWFDLALIRLDSGELVHRHCLRSWEFPNHHPAEHRRTQSDLFGV